MMAIHSARRLAAILGMRALAWKLRKLDFAIPRNGLVLDVGSGSAPNPYADVLVDYDPEGRETNAGKAQSNGKALVWADVQRLPFRETAFDFIMCFHVLEHVDDPRACLEELQRVGRAGYIETPNEIFDHVVPYHDHKNRVSFDGDVLRVLKKSRWNAERFEERYGAKRARQIIDMLLRDPQSLHVCYRWERTIRYEVVGERIEDGQPAVSRDEWVNDQEPLSPWVNTLASRLIRRQRVDEARLLTLLRCIDCRSVDLAASSADGVGCKSCGRVYPRINGFLDFRPQ